jgi:hypothetical protein
MWCRSYRNHVIMAFPSFDTATGLWAPQANISWLAGPLRKSQFVRFPKRVISEGEAVTCASRAAQTWIDKRLKELRDVSRQKDDMISRTAGLQRPVPVRTVEFQRKIQPHDTYRSLTFASFKAQVAKSGVTVSGESLEKSYSALLALRKRNHYSWTQIRSKMAEARIHATRARGDPLPLTMRDWQRIM